MAATTPSGTSRIRTSGTQHLLEISHDITTGPGGIYARLEEAGYQLDHFVERVTCRVASDAESSALHLNRGSPVLAVTRTAYDTNGTPVETNDMVLAGDRYELIYELPAD
ncbi:MAG: UTRA domain-containing protein [Pseudonocardiaceae bacterium]